MKVSEVMHKGISTVQINDSLKKVANLMKQKNIGAVPVYKNERPVGFVTDRDIVISSIAEGHANDAPISQAMSNEIIYAHEDDEITVATKMMRDNQVSRLIVVDRGEVPVGMISLHDIIEHVPDSQIIIETLSDIKRH